MTVHGSAASRRAPMTRWAGRVVLLAGTGAGLWLLGSLGSTASAEQVPSPPELPVVTEQVTAAVFDSAARPVVAPVVAPVIEPVTAPVVQPVTAPIVAPVAQPGALPVVAAVARPIAERVADGVAPVVGQVSPVVAHLVDVVAPVAASVEVRVGIPGEVGHAATEPAAAGTVIATATGSGTGAPVAAQGSRPAAPPPAAERTTAGPTALSGPHPAVPVGVAEQLPWPATPLDPPMGAPTPATSSVTGSSSTDQAAAVLGAATRTPLDCAATRRQAEPPGPVAGSPFDPSFSPD